METNGGYPEGVIERPADEILGKQDLTLLSEKANAEEAENSLRNDVEGFGFLVSHRILDFLLRRERSDSKTIRWFITIGVGAAGVTYIAYRRYLRSQQKEQDGE